MMCPPHDSCFFTFYDKHSLFILKFYFGPTGGVGYFFCKKIVILKAEFYFKIFFTIN